MPIVETSLSVTVDSPWIESRVDRLVQQWTAGSRSQVMGLFDHRCVSINGAVTMEPGRRLAVGDHVAIRYDNSRRYHPIPPAAHRSGVSVIYEDRNVIVVLKPAELLSVPTRRGERNTLVDRVHDYVRKVSGGRGAFIVQRLDRGVSGLMVFGKSLAMADRLRDQFEARKPERKYVAIVAGQMTPHEGVFESYLATDKSLNRYSTTDEEVGQLAITHFCCREFYDGATMVDVWLETGRRNQIRVHFAEAGYPLLGDPRYRPELARHRLWSYQRIALHAATLAFNDPITGETRRFQSPLPPEMVSFVSLAGRPKNRPSHGQASEGGAPEDEGGPGPTAARRPPQRRKKRRR
jgi:23S rRNA pseudouridine1911/1915/1917 synthase